MSPARVRIVEFTDPACPWAFSAEPFRRALDWAYGDAITWEVRLVGLAATPEEYADKGFTPDKLSAAYRQIRADHGMPIDARERPRMAATLPACRAVVAARLHAPASMRRLLRALRVRGFAGALLDEPATIAGAAADAGLNPDVLQGWMAGDDVAGALDEDLALARDPSPAARVLEDKLTSWEGGLRYTCPSYELERVPDGLRLSAPGFQPLAAYEVALANLLPDVERREPPGSALEMLRWAGEPLATKEVAVLRDITVADAREELSRVAEERPLGQDGLWSVPAA